MAELIVVLVPILYLIFVVSTRFGLIDRIRGLDHVERFTSNLEVSHREDARRLSRPTDPEWRALRGLIARYSKAEIPKDPQPKVIALWRDEPSDVRFAEWVAPTTPIVFMFTDFREQEQLTAFSVCFVGTLGDLRLWIERARDDLRFLVQDVFLTAFTVLLGLFIWFADRGN